MISPAEIPAIYILAAGIILLFIGYFLGRVIQSIEDGLLLIAIRIIGGLAIAYFLLSFVFGITVV